MCYIEETLKFIESKVMREHFQSRLVLFYGEMLELYLCDSIVCRAPAPLETKIPVLELIAEQKARCANHDFYNPAKEVELARYALAERYNSIPGEVYLLCKYKYGKRKQHYCMEIYTSFDAAAECIKYLARDGEHNLHSGIWYSIVRHTPSELFAARKAALPPHAAGRAGTPGAAHRPHLSLRFIDEKGEMHESFSWTFNNKGELWYFYDKNTKNPMDSHNFLGV